MVGDDKYDMAGILGDYFMGRYLFVDGQKSIDLPQYRDSAWTFYSERPAQEDDELYASVAAVFRAVNRTADALASLPFALLRGKTDYDTSDDWQNKVGFMPRPQELIRLWRLSLIMTNTAYGFMEQEKGGKRKLRYILPSSITPLYDAENGLTAFRRTVGAGHKDYPPDGLPIVPIWRLDHTTELIPSKNTEFKAMCHAAGILYWGDDLAEGVLKRGGIPPTMLMVKGVPNPTDREKIENIWDKVVRGSYRFLGKIFNADAIQAQKIGLGVDDLKDQALFDNKIADVAMAIGMPLSLLLANSANYATAQTEYSGWFRDAITPWAEFMAGELNEHLFTALGLKLVFRPEQTDPGQEEEVQRAQAFGSYVSAGLKPSIAAQIVGIELPEGVEYEDLDPEEQPAPLQEAQPTTDNAPVDETQPQEKPAQPPAKFIPSIDQYRELEHWRDVAQRKFNRNESLDFPWEAKTLPESVAAEISERLKSANGVEEIKAAFEMGEVDPMLLLAEELRLTRKMVEAEKV